MKQEPEIEYKMKEVKTRQHKNTEHECDMNLGSKINQEVHKKKTKNRNKVDKLDKKLTKKQDRTDTHTHTQQKYTD